MPRTSRNQNATIQPDQSADAPPAKRTRRSRMQDDALADANQLDKQLASARNKCRKLAVDFDWSAIDDMVLSTEFVELGKKADGLTDAKIAKMTEKEKDEMLKELRADIRQVAIAESARNDSMPHNEGEEESVSRFTDSEKQANIVANRADIASRQADAKGVTGAAKDKAVADAVAKAEASAAEKARKQMEAVQAKQAEAEAKAKAAQKKVEEAEKALEVERKAKEAAEKAKAAEEKKTRAAAKQAADAKKAKEKAEAEAVAQKAASAYKAKESKKNMPVNEGVGKRKKSNPPSPADVSAEDARIAAMEDGEEEVEEEVEEEPEPPPKKKRVSAAEKKKAFIEENGQEAWDDQEAEKAAEKAKKQKEKQEKDRKLASFDKIQKRASDAKETLTNANKQISELEGMNTELEDSNNVLEKTVEKAREKVLKLKRKRDCLKAAQEALVQLAQSKGATEEEIEEAMNTPVPEGDDEDHP